MPIPTMRKWLGIELIEVSATEKFVAALGGGLAITLLMAITGWILPVAESLAVVGSMGASAVLLFAVPHGQLSQPWPLFGGHVISAIIGVTCAQVISSPVIAAGLAVGLAIGAMHQLKCIHPPGGATAFAAVMGGDAVRELAYGFVLIPVTVNALTMITLAVVFNAPFKWRRYPAILNQPLRRAKPSNPQAIPPSHEEVLAALRSLDSFVDISEEDLIRLTKRLCQPVQYAELSMSSVTSAKSDID